MKLKQNYLLSIALGLLMLTATSISFSQQAISSQRQQVKVNQSVQSLQTKQYSDPNTHIHHDGTPCATDGIMDKYLTANGLKEQFQAAYQQGVQEAMANQGVEDKVQYTIPVIFHVVYKTAAQNVTNAQIMAVFNKLNQDYQLQNADASNARGSYGFVPANVDVNFCLAQRDPLGNPLSEPGVHRVSTTVNYFNPNTNENDMKYTATGGTPSWDRTKYLNVWIANISNGAGYGIAGYAYLATTSSLPPAAIDGIVIDYDMGMYVPGRVLTHEVGHYLGLPHTWGNYDGQGCSNGNDGLADTPKTAGPSFNYSGSCSGNQQTCSGTQTQYENFMDYSNCTVMFTANQATLMRSVLASSRLSLASSNACTPVNPVPPVADFTANITTVVSGGTVNFTDLSTNYPTSWSWSISPATGWSYTGGTSSTSQNPKVQFNNVGQYTIALTATNGSGNNTKTKNNYINVIASGGGSTACDTLRNYTAAEFNNSSYYSITNEIGYYPGNATLNNGAIKISRVAEKYTATTSSQLRAVRLAVMKAADMGAANDISFKVYQDNAGYPGTAIATVTKPISSLDPLYWNIIEFPTTPTVSGDFWIGMEWSTAAPFDTLAFLTTDFSARPSGNATTACYLGSSYGWKRTDEIFNGGSNVSMIMDALLSNGPAPVASMTITPTQTCLNTLVNANGFASTNTTDYEWRFISGSNTYYGDGGDLYFDNLPVGTWTVELHAHGSCLEDVKTGTLIIKPKITRTVNKTDAHCDQTDGSITVTNIAGSNGGPYSVSINNGATFVNTAPYNFTNLSAGTYITIVKDNYCADTSNVVIANLNSFNPTVSPGTAVTITSGDNVTLTANGGTTWEWYEQGQTNPFSTSSSVNVSPTVTTTYIVYIVDANGCEKTLTIVVTVNPTSSIAIESDGQNITIYPNPSTGIFKLNGKFANDQNLTVQVYNLIGEIIISEKYNQTKKLETQLDLSRKDSGAYIVRVSGEFGTYTQRIVVVK
ncbi:MAG: M43 family zinc metalloprotease [Brumimicrobium sp.]|nr:M43 family zinc metalloprotease [Brumimicrobium sp.]